MTTPSVGETGGSTSRTYRSKSQATCLTEVSCWSPFNLHLTESEPDSLPGYMLPEDGILSDNIWRVKQLQENVVFLNQSN